MGAIGRWFDRYKWLLSLVNLAILVAGVLGFWRDRIVVNEMQLQQQATTLGEVKQAVLATQATASATATDVAVMKEKQEGTNTKIDALDRRLENVEKNQNEFNQRLGVVEQRRGR